MKNITTIIATTCKTLDEFENRPIWKSLEKQTKLHGNDYFDFVIIKDNKEGLSKVYNKFLTNEKYKNQILLFVHDDVELEDIFLVDKLNQSPYTVTGLAGCKQVDLTKPPAWHLMSNRESHVGEVSHAAEGKTWTSVFGVANSRALLIDGLFMAVDVDKILLKNVFFDEDFDFHHYDLSFCLNCNKNKISVGVLPIKVVHHGLGDSMNSVEWQKSADKFFEKFAK